MNILKPEQQLSDASANFSISNNKKKLVGLGALFILIMMIAVSIFFYFRGATLSRSELTNNNDYAQKEQGNTNDASQNNKTSKFFEKNGKMYLQDTNNLSLRNPLLFEKADPLTFRYITKFTGFDDKYLHFAEYDSNQKTYVAVSTELSSTELEMLRIFDPNVPITIKWTEPNKIDSKVLLFSGISESLLRAIDRSLVTVGTPTGELARVILKGTNPERSVHSTGNSLLIFTEKATYQAKNNEPVKEILDLGQKYTSYRSGDNIFYYFQNSSNAQTIYSYDLENQETKEVYVFTDRFITDSSRLLLSSDGNFLAIRVSKESHGDNELEASDIVLIDVNNGSATIVAKSNLTPIALSRDNSKIFAISVPYEGAPASRIQYFIKKANGLWQQEPLEMDTAGIVGQWITSPRGNYMAFTAETDSAVIPCELGLESQKTKNALRILNLSTLSVSTLETGFPLDNYTIGYWQSDESGFYFKKNTYALAKGESPFFECNNKMNANDNVIFSEKGKPQFIQIPR